MTKKKVYHKKCIVCGTKFDTLSSVAKYCSSSCKSRGKTLAAQNRCSPSISACLNCTKKECTYGEKPTEEEMSVIKCVNLGENLLTINMKVGV